MTCLGHWKGFVLVNEQRELAKNILCYGSCWPVFQAVPALYATW